MIKHNNDFTNNLNSIPELKNVYEFESVYHELNEFYNRVKQPVSVFLKELVSAIYDELYKFDEEKIDAIAESLAIRMDKNDATILINRLSKIYK